ncbi:MAG: Dihydrolipoyllysine-residue acetyltransferase component of pyruvate dehydrogenase complex [Planctomycetes bacterium ADurb.Bin401]|nr:MAG: Dihydrolipoyllysine-residue acetyltransferase component of pyruvate dehydrogenase complex [Planctomycetes bacterium ADurb.Bin401]
MGREIKLAQMGQTMEEGTIVSCKIKPGQKINKGDVIFEVETDKATLEMESPAEGIVKEIVVAEGQTVPVGDLLVILEDEVKAAPAAAKKTETAKAVEPAYKPGQKVPLNKFMKIIGEKMVQSKREIPCFYLNVAVDVTDLAAYRQKLNSEGNVKVSFNDLIIKALGLGIAKWPIMSGRFEGDSIQIAESIGIGLAISVKNGLVAPIVKEVEKKSIQEIAQYSTALIERAKNGKLTPSDIDGGCITVSNLGAFGIESFIPIVVPGQCSILGIGKIADTCVSSDGNIVIRKMMKMTLAVDHRIANGAEAAQFLDFVAKMLAEPEKLI